MRPVRICLNLIGAYPHLQAVCSIIEPIRCADVLDQRRSTAELVQNTCNKCSLSTLLSSVNVGTHILSAPGVARSLAPLLSPPLSGSSPCFSHSTSYRPAPRSHTDDWFCLTLITAADAAETAALMTSLPANLDDFDSNLQPTLLSSSFTLELYCIVCMRHV